MSFLLDTNVFSEIRKGLRCNAGVRTWFAETDSGDLWMSVLVVGEIRRGIELIRRRDRRQATALDRWLGSLMREQAERILPVSQLVAETWGEMTATRPLSPIDGLLAATAVVHDLTLVTRNRKHVLQTGARCLDPFSA